MKRPFKGLRQRGPEASYDAVIAGAGTGGRSGRHPAEAAANMTPMAVTRSIA